MLLSSTTNSKTWSLLLKRLLIFDDNLVFINEVGLDPGIDHFFSHLLVKKLKETGSMKKTDRTGTIVQFWPSKKIFSDTKLGPIVLS